MTTPLLIQFLLCPLVLVSLLSVSAPYGRHFRPGWGPVLPNRLAWFVMELPALCTLPVLVFWRPGHPDAQISVPVVLWTLHYSYRTLLFPALMKPSGKSFPVLLVLFAVVFNLLNGYNNAEALIVQTGGLFRLRSVHFLVGGVVFFGGFLLHVKSDAIIRGLRSEDSPDYRIPAGGAFRWVGSPHYLGEIIQWCGWAILTWSLAGLAFALFTVCNLLPRAIANHRWYRTTFPDYPTGRRILIPGLF